MIPVIDRRSSQKVVVVEHHDADDPYFMSKAKAVAPGIHAEALREKKQREAAMIIPRPLRRKLRKAYRSRNRQAIDECLAEAIVKGVSKEAIKLDFEKWKQERQFSHAKK